MLKIKDFVKIFYLHSDTLFWEWIMTLFALNFWIQCLLQEIFKLRKISFRSRLYFNICHIAWILLWPRARWNSLDIIKIKNLIWLLMYAQFYFIHIYFKEILEFSGYLFIPYLYNIYLFPLHITWHFNLWIFYRKLNIAGIFHHLILHTYLFESLRIAH